MSALFQAARCPQAFLSRLVLAAQPGLEPARTTRTAGPVVLVEVVHLETSGLDSQEVRAEVVAREVDQPTQPASPAPLSK
jgi:hypothetical protein